MTSSKLDWALHHAGKGLKVFPVHPNCKQPIHKNWPDLATSDPAQISDWWRECPDANIGCTPGASGHIVIDIDTKKVDGHKTMSELQNKLGIIPPTMTTETPTGGTHLWLKLEGSCKNSAGALGLGIDTRGMRGFVVMGGSTIDNIPYKTNEAPIIRTPEGWRARLAQLGAKDENRDAAKGITIDDPGNIERAKAHVQSAIERGDVAIEGSGGNDRTYRLASALRDFGLTEATALEVAEPWNRASIPPWDTSEIETIFENAYNYAQNEVGAKAMADPSSAGFAGIQLDAQAAVKPMPHASTGEARPNRFALLSVEAMAELPDPAWLVEGWLPHYELSMLFGPYGSFKSFAALDFALSIATGVPALGMDYDQKRFPVLYIAGEGQIGIAKQRVPAWLKFHKVTEQIPFHMIREMPLARNGDVELAQMFNAIEETCDEALPRLIVIDTHARSMSGLDENTVQDTAKTIEFYEKVLKRYSCAGLIVHHSGIDAQRERGSTALGGACSSIFHMEYDASQRVATLSCKKMKDAEPPKSLHLEPTRTEQSVVLTQKQWTKQDANPKPSHSELYSDVVRILNANGAHSLGSAITTTTLASDMPGVENEPDAALQERARRNMTATLNKAAKKELRIFVHTDEKPLHWYLPPIPLSD